MTDSLIIDNRATMQGPGLHVFIVGVSDYAHLPAHDDVPRQETWGLQKLGAPALTAYRLFEWLRQADAARGGASEEPALSRPLKTCRILLSPTVEEAAAAPGLATLGAPGAGREEFQKAAWAWRKDAVNDPDGATLFYFGGHGIQQGPEGALLMLADLFEADRAKLHNTVDFANLRNGMAPSDGFKTLPKEQFYFVDCCRYTPEPMKNLWEPNVGRVFDVVLNTVDDRLAPAFFATTDGRLAASRRGVATLFGEALLHGLANGADNAREGATAKETVWPVTVTTLKLEIERYIEANALKQQIVVSGYTGDPELVLLPKAPLVELTVEITPKEPLFKTCGIKIIHGQETELFAENPWETEPINAGKVTYGGCTLTLCCSQLPTAYRRHVYIGQRFKMPWRHDLSTALV